MVWIDRVIVQLANSLFQNVNIIGISVRIGNEQYFDSNFVDSVGELITSIGWVDIDEDYVR